MRIAAVGRALPANEYDQAELVAALGRLWADRFHNPARLAQIQRNTQVASRRLALPIEVYAEIAGFGDANDRYIECALELGEAAIRDALARADLPPRAIDHLYSISITGLATPSLDARLINRLGLRADVKRTPIFGLGCVGGAIGLTRAADAVRAFPRETALVLATELCSLTLQRGDASIPNVIASGLFGDGAAAVVVRGAEALPRPTGPAIRATRSIFYPDSERVMGWDVRDGGFQVVLSADVPDYAAGLRPDVEKFLADQGLSLADVGVFLCHPGGPKVLEAVERSLALPPDALARSWRHLESVGNLSSASVLFVLADALEEEIASGTPGLLLAMGPGFCSELVLLEF